MGEAAEKIGQGEQISREEQDKDRPPLARERGARLEDGTYAGEVMHVIPPPYDSLAEDNLVRKDSTLEAYASLPPSLRSQARDDHRGNSSPLTDGAKRAFGDDRGEAKSLVTSRSATSNRGRTPRSTRFGSC